MPHIAFSKDGLRQLPNNLMEKKSRHELVNILSTFKIPDANILLF